MKKPAPTQINPQTHKLKLYGLKKLFAHSNDSVLIERASYYLLCLPETIGWHYKGVYAGHTLKQREDGWLLVVTIIKEATKYVVFASGQTPQEAVRDFAVRTVNNLTTLKISRF